MTKKDFLTVLQEALSEELNGAQVSEQMNYYRRYFDEQTAAGRSEAQILEALGDARMIARNIIDGIEDASNMYQQSTTTYTNYSDAEAEAGMEPLWKTKVKVYGAIGLILVIIFVVLALITQLIIWLLPSIIVIGAILWILRKLNGR